MNRCRRLAALKLPLVILLFPASAWGRTVCFGETVSGDLLAHLLVSTTLLFLVQFLFYATAQLSWVITKAIWPPADGSYSAPWLYLVAAMATLTSALLGIWGTFLAPMYRLILFGASSSALWDEAPALVHLLFSTGYYSWLIPVAMITLWQAARRCPRGARYFEIALFVEVVVLYSILWTIYQYTIVLACPVSS